MKKVTSKLWKLMSLVPFHDGNMIGHWSDYLIFNMPLYEFDFPVNESLWWQPISYPIARQCMCSVTLTAISLYDQKAINHTRVYLQYNTVLVHMLSMEGWFHNMGESIRYEGIPTATSIWVWRNYGCLITNLIFTDGYCTNWRIWCNYCHI